MNPYQITLIQNSFTLVLPIADEAAALFYGRLFELDPSLRPLFTTDMNQQGRKLMSTLAVVVADLEKPEALVGAVRRLGRRHAGMVWNYIIMTRWAQLFCGRSLRGWGMNLRLKWKRHGQPHIASCQSRCKMRP